MQLPVRSVAAVSDCIPSFVFGLPRVASPYTPVCDIPPSSALPALLLSCPVGDFRGIDRTCKLSSSEPPLYACRKCPGIEILFRIPRLHKRKSLPCCVERPLPCLCTSILWSLLSLALSRPFRFRLGCIPATAFVDDLRDEVNIERKVFVEVLLSAHKNCISTSQTDTEM
jgi:hypothetical protein